MNANKIIVGPVGGGLKTTNLPFFIDNDSFPVLINAYQWRGRVKRKRGTSLLGRILRYFNSEIISYTATVTILLNGSGAGNLISGFGIEAGANIVPGTTVIVDRDSVLPPLQTYRDLLSNGFLTPTGTGGPNTINFATGAILIPAAAGHNVTAEFIYYPNLPVMGLEDFNVSAGTNPGNVAFNTTRAYNIDTTFPYEIYDISFYKRPAADGTTMPGYVQKADYTPTTWNGQDYQQFWTTNYQGAFWATNGVSVPFNAGSIGMQFAPSNTITYVANTATTIDVTIAGSPLVVGDFVFFNEWTTGVPENAVALNFQTGYATTAAAPNYTITLPFANLPIVAYTPGIIQYLTNRSDITKDCIRWYDGAPTTGNSPPSTTKGWVNFMPPVSRESLSVAHLPPRQYYLVGARLIQPFKDRLVFFGPVVQASTGSAIYLQDVALFSQNGTAYYTASFASDPSLANTGFSPLIVPDNQTATPNAYWSDQTGFGGWIPAGTDQPILTCINNEDVLLLGCPTTQMRFIYTGNDLLPFNFYSVDTDLSTTSTFSQINLGSSALTRGNRGIINTTQREANRIDTDILDQNAQVRQGNNGDERYTAQRDYLNEWVYFTYLSNQDTHIFPNQTLFYNYRDNSWAVFNESYTTYGQFRKRTGYTWATIGTVYPTWGEWNVPWNSGASTLLTPEVIAGNAQGFIMFRDEGTGEGKSLYIQAILNTSRQITSPNHCLNEGDFVILSDVKGVTNANGRIFKVAPPVTQNTFRLMTKNQNSPFSGTYIGGGLIKRIYNPFIQTKQFPVSWGMGRKTRLGVQKYLLNATEKGQITLLIYLSTDSAFAYNSGGIVPGTPGALYPGQKNIPLNNALIYSTVLYTCPESTNLGLTPENINLQFINSGNGKTGQQQVWHRINTSLIGDTVQLGFTMSDTQLHDTSLSNQFAEIEINGFILDVYPSQLLC